MGQIYDSLKSKLEAQFAPTFLQVVDDSHGHSRGVETHFTVVVVSEKFAGVSRLDRSRQVSLLLEPERKLGLHALSIKTFTPQEWDQVKEQFQLEPPACRGGGKH